MNFHKFFKKNDKQPSLTKDPISELFIRIAIPSKIENIGILLDLISSNALFKIVIPCFLTNIAPIIPVMIIKEIVFKRPICLPMVIKSITSIKGITIKIKKNMFVY